MMQICSAVQLTLTSQACATATGRRPAVMLMLGVVVSTALEMFMNDATSKWMSAAVLEPCDIVAYTLLQCA